jgi:pyruvate formate lyase activating enzyme
MTPPRENKEATVTDIQRFCVHDGPGIRTVVFLKGCPLHCAWCQNPECIDPGEELLSDPDNCIFCLKCMAHCPRKAIRVTEAGLVTDRELCDICGECTVDCFCEARKLVGRKMDVDAVFAVVSRDERFFKNSGGGVTLSGGEPLMQWEFSAALLKKCKEAGITTALETSGYCSAPRFESVVRHVEYLLFDIKIVDPKRHVRYTGKSNGAILANLATASSMNITTVLRVPLIPTVNDDEENLSAVCALAKKNRVQEVHLLPYHELGAPKYRNLGKEKMLHTFRTPSTGDLNRAKKVFSRHGVPVRLDGRTALR